MPVSYSGDLPSGISIRPGAGGLTTVSVHNPVVTGEVVLQGAHLTGWTPARQDPVLFLSREAIFAPRRPIRGGVPVCFPWFDAGPDGGRSPAHGIARITEWDLTDVVDDEGTVTLTLVLDSRELPAADAELLDAPFRLTYRIEMGETLTLTADVEALDQPLDHELALHTFLAVHDVTGVAIDGLDGATFWDKNAEKRGTQDGTLVVEGAADLVVDRAHTVTVRDPGRRRVLTLEPTGATSTVVWNPGPDGATELPDLDVAQWPLFVCVETAALGDGVGRLAPGESRQLGVEISVAAL